MFILSSHLFYSYFVVSYSDCIIFLVYFCLYCESADSAGVSLCLGSAVLRVAEADRSRVTTGTLQSASRQALLLPRRRQHWDTRAARQRQRHATRSLAGAWPSMNRLLRSDISSSESIAGPRYQCARCAHMCWKLTKYFRWWNTDEIVLQCRHIMEWVL